MFKALFGCLIIFVVLAGWVWVQQRYAAFARQHPGLGPFRAPDGSCGGGCAYQGGQCARR